MDLFGESQFHESQWCRCIAVSDFRNAIVKAIDEAFGRLRPWNMAKA